MITLVVITSFILFILFSLITFDSMNILKSRKVEVISEKYSRLSFGIYLISGSVLLIILAIKFLIMIINFI